MRYYKISRWAFCVLTILSAHLAAQDKKAALNDYFNALAENRHFSGNVLIAENGKVVYEQSCGDADPISERPMKLTTQFSVGSITKVFTATAIMQLQEKGKLKVSDPVTKYLPDFPYPDITITHLLSHTSGLPSFDDLFDTIIKDHPDTVLTNKDFVTGTIAAGKQLYFKPGEKFSYNNANFTVLSLIVERITDISIDDYMTRHILQPAGMKHTFFSTFNFLYTKKEAANLSIPYYLPHQYSDVLIKADTISFLSRYWHVCNFKGFGEMITTVQDLLNYDQALYNGKLLDSTSIEEMYTPVKLNNGQPNPGVWGLGWQIDHVGKMVNHGGGAAGSYAAFTRYLEKHQTAIIFSNSRDALTRPVANDALKILNGQHIYPKKQVAYLYGHILVKDGLVAATRFLTAAQRDTAVNELNEKEFNEIGSDLGGMNTSYHLSPEHHYQEALQVFKLITELYPNSWNAFHNYASALELLGNKTAAISMFEKSLALNPNDTVGAAHLKRLSGK